WALDAPARAAKGTLVATLGFYPAEQVRLSPDGHWLATVDLRGKLQLWDIHSDRVLAPVPPDKLAPPNGSRFTTASWAVVSDRDLHKDRGPCLWEFVRPTSRTYYFAAWRKDADRARPVVAGLVFSPNGRWL